MPVTGELNVAIDVSGFQNKRHTSSEALGIATSVDSEVVPRRCDIVPGPGRYLRRLDVAERGTYVREREFG